MNRVNSDDIDKYFTISEISGISKKWLDKVRIWLNEYLDYVNYDVDEINTLDYIKTLKDTHSITSYRKKTYQIRRFLEYLKCDWASNIRPPAEPILRPVRIGTKDIESTLNYIKGNNYEIQFRALIHLGMDSGMRAEELYQLKPYDINLDNRIVYINHDPSNGQTTKSKTESYIILH